MATVVVVDDDGDLAESCATLVQARAGLETLWTTSPDDALRLLAEHPVEVAVLDQRMPGRTGTDLLKEMRRLNPQLRSIMLSGEATAEEVGRGFDLFNGFVAKQRISELPGQVLRQTVAFHAALAEVGCIGEVIHVERRYGFLRPVMVYRLVRSDVLDDYYVAPESWESYLQLEAGESRKYVQQRYSGRKMQLETQSRVSLKSSFGASAAKTLSNKIENALERTRKHVGIDELSRTESTERNLSLPAEPASLTKVYVKSRHLSRAPLFTRVRVVLTRECVSCNDRKLVPVVLHKYTGFYATRHEDHTSDGLTRITDTGRIPVAAA
ncbi:response regulator [Actinoplanes sp. NPDC004185]